VRVSGSSDNFRRIALPVVLVLLRFCLRLS